MLNEEQLNKLSTQRLINILKKARITKSRMYYCEICGDNACDIHLEEMDKVLVENAENYYNLIKEILTTREHMPRKKRKLQKRNLVKRNRKGNRLQ